MRNSVSGDVDNAERCQQGHQPVNVVSKVSHISNITLTTTVRVIEVDRYVITLQCAQTT
jgi:hypothetical protein